MVGYKKLLINWRGGYRYKKNKIYLKTKLIRLLYIYIHMHTLKKISKKTVLRENTKFAKLQVINGKLTSEEFKQLVGIDPSPTKKYVGWMAKQWIAKNVTDIDELRNKIEEYDAFFKSGKAKTKDVYQFTSFDDLKKEVGELNAIGSESNSELRDDYEVVMDTDRLYIAVPHTHEASRYLGISKFQYRDCEGGTKDSAWCTTYKSPDHFTDYYFKQNYTIYYIRIIDELLIEEVKVKFPKRGGAMVVTAVLITKEGVVHSWYDGNDKTLTQSEITTFHALIGI